MLTKMNLRSAVLMVFSIAPKDKSSPRKVYFKILNVDNDKYRIIYQSSNLSSVLFTIKDMEGHLVYEKQILNLSGPEQTFDLSKIPRGTYSLGLKNLNKRDREEITFENWKAQDLEILSQPKPHRALLDGVNRYGSDLTFRIMDQDWKEYISEPIFKNCTIYKMYNFKKMEGDVVNLVLYNDEEIVKHAQFELS